MPIAGFEVAKGDSSAMKMTPQQAPGNIFSGSRKYRSKDAAKTKDEGDKFPAANKTKQGVYNRQRSAVSGRKTGHRR